MKTLNSNSVSSKVVLEFSSKRELRECFYALNSAIVKLMLFRDDDCVGSFQKDIAQKDIDLLVKVQHAINPVFVYGVK